MMNVTNRKSGLKNSFTMLCIATGIAIPTDGSAQTSEDGLSAAEIGDYSPKKYSAGRYRSTYANSAFEREILPPDTGQQGPPPTPFDMKIVSASGKDGRYRVVLIDKKGKYQVVTDEPDADGFHYSDIEPAAKIQDFRVQVSMGGQTEWAEFDTKRNTISAKKRTPPKPTNRTGRPAVVPNKRKIPPKRTGVVVPPSKTAKAAGKKSGSAAQAAIEKANAAALKPSAAASSRVSGRRVVLPPKGR